MTGDRLSLCKRQRLLQYDIKSGSASKVLGAVGRRSRELFGRAMWLSLSNAVPWETVREQETAGNGGVAGHNLLICMALICPNPSFARD
jgi:hypothetical protein